MLLTTRRPFGIFVAASAVLISAIVSSSALACPFCSAVSQTLRQEMETMDAVVIAEATTASERDAESGEVPLKVVRVLKGEKLIQPGTIVQTVYYGSVEPGRRFMLSGVEPAQLMWSSPLPVDEQAEEYLAAVLKLPEDDLEKLRFFQKYLQSETTMLARDAYDEFAIAPYDAVERLKDDMNHDRLVEWIKDPEMPADRRRLYLTMLGVCGTSEDVPMLEGFLRSTQKSARTGLDALIACYLRLAGAEGLPVIDELFLANEKAPYADTYGAIMAIRFHGTETDVIPRSELVKSLHHVLNRPDLADLVIPDLARWGDWTQLDRLVELFAAAEADNNWIRVPVVNYVRACPLPEAKAAMEKLKQIDPEAVKRANTYFTAPVPPAEKQPTSSDARQSGDVKIAKVSIGSPAAAVGLPVPKTSGMSKSGLLADAGPVAFASDRRDPERAASLGLRIPNRSQMLTVLATTTASLLIFGYLLISGGPQPRPQYVRQMSRR